MQDTTGTVATSPRHAPLLCVCCGVRLDWIDDNLCDEAGCDKWWVREHCIECCPGGD